MKLPEDQFLYIVRNLTKYYGPDIAHDVAVSILNRRNPLRKPENWAMAYAFRLSKKVNTQWCKPKLINFSDAGDNLTRRLRGLGLL